MINEKEMNSELSIEQAQDKAAREWNSACDYRTIRNGVQVGNIKLLHFDSVNKRAIEIYTASLRAELAKQKELKDELVKGLQYLKEQLNVYDHKSIDYVESLIKKSNSQLSEQENKKI